MDKFHPGQFWEQRRPFKQLHHSISETMPLLSSSFSPAKTATSVSCKSAHTKLVARSPIVAPPSFVFDITSLKIHKPGDLHKS